MICSHGFEKLLVENTVTNATTAYDRCSRLSVCGCCCTWPSLRLVSTRHSRILNGILKVHRWSHFCTNYLEMDILSQRSPWRYRLHPTAIRMARCANQTYRVGKGRSEVTKLALPSKIFKVFRFPRPRSSSRRLSFSHCWAADRRVFYFSLELGCCYMHTLAVGNLFHNPCHLDLVQGQKISKDSDTGAISSTHFEAPNLKCCIFVSTS